MDIINESIAFYMTKKYHTNIAEYNVYGLFEFLILCYYFNSVIDIFSKHKLGFYIAAIGIGFGVIDILLIQHLDVLNSYFLFVEGFCVIGMCLFAFFRLLLKNEELKSFRYPHFWFISIILFYWCITYLSWGLYDILGERFHEYISMISLSIWMVNIVTYGGLGSVFLMYRKIPNSVDR